LKEAGTKSFRDLERFKNPNGTRLTADLRIEMQKAMQTDLPKTTTSRSEFAAKPVSVMNTNTSYLPCRIQSRHYLLPAIFDVQNSILPIGQDPPMQ